MLEFWTLLTSPDGAFLRLAYALGLAASVAFGIVGSLVVVRRISYVAGAVAHALIGGVGLALYAQRVWGWQALTPLLGATLVGGLVALVLWGVQQRASERADSLIGAVWSLGMAGGLILLSLTPGYSDPMAYLTGDVLLVLPRDLWLVVGWNALLLTALAVGYPQMRAVLYDREFARVRGLPVGRYEVMLYLAVALTIVLLLQLLGAVLVVAMLTLPAATASRGAQTLGQMMRRASVLALIGFTGGISLSYFLDWPTGPAIVAVAGALYLAGLMRRAA